MKNSDGHDEVPLARRHETLEQLTSLLQRWWWGEAARELLAEHRDGTSPLPADGALVLRDMFTWVRHKDGLGRKDRGSDGEQLLTPIRVISQPIVVVEGKDPVQVPWHLCGPSYGATGTDVVDFNVATFSGKRHTLIEKLDALVCDANSSWWELNMLVEPWARVKIRSLLSRFSHELRSAGISLKPERLLSRDGVDEFVTDFFLGSSDQVVTSVVDVQSSFQQIVAQAMQPERFAKVDPLMWLNRTLYRDIDDALRKRIDDPRAGSRIRQVAAEVGITDFSRVAEAYNEQTPNGKTISVEAVRRALRTHEWLLSGSQHRGIDPSEVLSERFVIR